MKRMAMCAILLFASFAGAAQRYSVTGIVLKVDRPNKLMVVSCQSIPGYMEAMTMPFGVLAANELDGVDPGAMAEFMLVVDGPSSHAEHIRVHRYESVEQDPLTARRLKLLKNITHPASRVKALSVGEAVPDFTLIDQDHQPVTLSQFAGKVVAINFIYTSCPLPNFCFRISNNFGVLQRRFKEQLGRDLTLVTVTFDPVRDQPEVLARYASTWKADPKTWHFLTGAVPAVQRVTDLFGVDFFSDEGLMNHSLHTAIIDRQGRLATNIEGNQFTPDQLGDLVQAELARPAGDRESQASRARQSRR